MLQSSAIGPRRNTGATARSRFVFLNKLSGRVRKRRANASTSPAFGIDSPLVISCSRPIWMELSVDTFSRSYPNCRIKARKANGLMNVDVEVISANMPTFSEYSSLLEIGFAINAAATYLTFLTDSFVLKHRRKLDEAKWWLSNELLAKKRGLNSEDIEDVAADYEFKLDAVTKKNLQGDIYSFFHDDTMYFNNHHCFGDTKQRARCIHFMVCFADFVWAGAIWSHLGILSH